MKILIQNLEGRVFIYRSLLWDLERYPALLVLFIIELVRIVDVSTVEAIGVYFISESWDIIGFIFM